MTSSYQSSSSPRSDSKKIAELQQQLHHDSGKSSFNEIDLLTDQPLSSDFDNILANDMFFGGGKSSPYENNLLTSECDNNSILTTSNTNTTNNQQSAKSLSFDYLYEFSETRKVLEEFFTCQTNNDKILEKLSDFNESDGGGGGVSDILDSNNLQSVLLTSNKDDIILPNINTSNNTDTKSYIGQKLASTKYSNTENDSYHHLHHLHQNVSSQRLSQQHEADMYDQHDIELFLDSGSRSSGEMADNEIDHNIDGHTRNFTLSPETTDYDSNCGDLDSEVSLRYTGLGGEFGEQPF